MGSAFGDKAYLFPEKEALMALYAEEEEEYDF